MTLFCEVLQHMALNTWNQICNAYTHRENTQRHITQHAHGMLPSQLSPLDFINLRS